MKIPFFQIDAFARGPLLGNPAGVCPLGAWLPDKVMQDIAAMVNLSETAFFVPSDEGGGTDFFIRWFTPSSEVDLCGHATLGAAWCIFNELGYSGEKIVFQSRSGPLAVRRSDDLITLDFPVDPPRPCVPPADLLKAFEGAAPLECLRAADHILVFSDENAVRSATPDLGLLKNLDTRGVIITARSGEKDVICRFFAPRLGIDEDPVTGSAATELSPYWAGKTGRSRLRIRQLSARGGVMLTELKDGRVLIGGRAVKRREGSIDTDKVEIL
jgi:PhzF family phenazine biosynthesis protein